MKRIYAIILLILASSSWATEQATSKNIKPPFNLKWSQTTTFFSIPKDFIKGWIKVPEDYSKPQGKQIHIFYYCRPGAQKNTPPVIYFNGGPGGTSHDTYTTLCEKVTDRDFVFMDQRGTGLSSPYPVSTTEDIKRLPQYLSRSIVKDAEVLRKKLYGKNKKWSIAGSSFGSLIVQRYISLFPQSLISAHAHGYSATSEPQRLPEMRLRSHRRALNNYFKAYPNDQSTLMQLKKSFKDADRITKNKLKIVGDGNLDLVGFFMMSSQEYWRSFHQIINDSKNENGTISKSAFKRASHYFAFELMKMDNGQALVNIIFNRSEAYCTGADKSLTEFYHEVFNKMRAEGDDPLLWPAGEEALCHINTKGDLFQFADTMKLKTIDPLNPSDIVKGLTKNPELKLYLYSGSKDSISPPEMFSELTSKGKGSIIYKNFTDSGHEGIITQAAIWENLKKVHYQSLPKAI